MRSDIAGLITAPPEGPGPHAFNKHWRVRLQGQGELTLACRSGIGRKRTPAVAISQAEQRRNELGNSDDWSNLMLILIWALAAFFIFLPALATRGWCLAEELRDREKAHRTSVRNGSKADSSQLP